MTLASRSMPRSFPALFRTIRVACEHGIHLRVATGLVMLARTFRSDIRLRAGTMDADAKSLLSLVELGVGAGRSITVVTRGPDARQALEAVADFLSSQRVPCGQPAPKQMRSPSVSKPGTLRA